MKYKTPRWPALLLILLTVGVFYAVAHAEGPGAPLGDCKDYVVMLEPNSGPMPKEATAPRTLMPPRFSCDAGYKLYLGNSDNSGGLILCSCEPR